MRRDPKNHLTVDEFAWYINDEVPAHLQPALDEHVELCESCARELEAYFGGEDEFPEEEWAKRQNDFLARLQEQIMPKCGTAASIIGGFPKPPGPSTSPRPLARVRGDVQIARRKWIWWSNERLNGDLTFSIAGSSTTQATAAQLAGRTCELWHPDSKGGPWKQFKLADRGRTRDEIRGTIDIRKDERIDLSAERKVGIVILLRAGVLVIDCSSGVTTDNLLAVRRTCEDFVGAVDLATSKIGVIQFGMDGHVSVLCPLCPDQDMLADGLKKLRLGESSHLAEAIERATDMLGDCPAETDRFMVILVNGVPDDYQQAIAASRRAKEAGIEVFCIASPQADRAMLGQLASGPETMMPADDPDRLSRAFEDVAKRVSS